MPRDLLALLDDLLCVGNLAGVDDQNGWFLPSARPVQRLGMALEPGPDFGDWVVAERLDAVFLHRPWRLTDSQRQTLREAEIGVLAYHLAFDERLTTGFNPALAAACGWGEPEILGRKEGRSLGMVCALPIPVSFDAVTARLHAEFEGLEQVAPPSLPPPGQTISHVAVVGAMTDALVREAHARGVGAYITGQWRQPARAAVRETGLGVVALGHRRSELWGLRTLARWLRKQTERTEMEIIPYPV